MYHYVCTDTLVYTCTQGSIALVSNPGITTAIAGLATSASYQSGVDRHMMWLVSGTKY